MGRLLFTVVGLFIALVLALLILPFVLPIDSYVNQAGSQVKESTGRQLRVHGGTSFRLFPTIKLTVKDVSLENPPGFSSPNFATLDEFSMAVKLIPLFSGQLEIDGFVLTRPKIEIETLADGRTNAQFKGEAKIEADENDEAKPAKGEVKVTGQAGLRLKNVKLIDGQVTLIDQAKQSRQVFTAINVAVDLDSLDHTLSVDGGLTYRDRPLKATLTLDPARALISRKVGKLNLVAETSGAKVTYAGQIHVQPELGTQGDVAANIAKIPEILSWLGVSSPPAYLDLDTLDFAGKLAYQARIAHLTEAKLTMGPAQAEGEVRADLSGPVPEMSGKLNVKGAKGLGQGLEVPVIVAGPLNNISLRPDVEGLIKDKLGDPSALVNELAKIKKDGASPEEKAKDLIKGVLGR